MAMLEKRRPDAGASAHEEGWGARAIRDHRPNYRIVNCDEFEEEPGNENGYRFDRGVSIFPREGVRPLIYVNWVEEVSGTQSGENSATTLMVGGWEGAGG